MNYKIIGPKGRSYADAPTWAEAVDLGVTMSIRWRFLFCVGQTGTRLPFERERRRVLKAAYAYVKETWAHGDSSESRMLKWRYHRELRTITTLFQSHSGRYQEEFVSRSLTRSAFPVLNVK